MKQRRANEGGFSLVEVALALGVAAFVLVATISICTASFTAGKGVTDDTLVASMSSNLVDDFRRQAFANVQAITTSTTFFDNDGIRLQDASGNDLARAAALTAGAIYECDTTVAKDTGTLNSDGTANLLQLKLKFTWPVQSAAPPNVKYIHATLANY